MSGFAFGFAAGSLFCAAVFIATVLATSQDWKHWALPRFYWGESMPHLPELRYYGFAWGILTIGRWQLARGYRSARRSSGKDGERG